MDSQTHCEQSRSTLATGSSSSLAEDLPKEIERVQNLIPLYESIGPSSAFAVAMMRSDIKQAHVAMMAGDLVVMLRIYKSLTEYSA